MPRMDGANGPALAAQYDRQCAKYRDAAAAVYIEIFPWWRAAYADAVVTAVANNDTKADFACRQRGGKEWTQLTGLPRLDEINGKGWNAAVVTVGRADLVGYVPDREGIVAVLAWAMVKRAAASASAVSATCGTTPPQSPGWQPAGQAFAAKVAADPTAQKALSTNARMMATLADNHDSRGWSVRKWADQLQCSKSHVQKQPTWQELVKHNAATKGELQNRRK